MHPHPRRGVRLTPNPSVVHFHDRADAGRQLARRLRAYRERPSTLVLGLPRGGSIVAAEVARDLRLPLETWVARKIGAPANPEVGVGAVSHLDTLVWDPDSLEFLGLLPTDLAEEVHEQAIEMRRRLRAFRQGAEAPPDVSGQSVILIDDGVATGVTAIAAIQALRKAGASHIVVALPVAPRDALANLKAYADDVVALNTPASIDGVGNWYDDFHQATDAEVVRALRVAPSLESGG